MTSNRALSHVQTIGAFLIALCAFGLPAIFFDQTPMLIDPGPDLDWPLGMIGIAMGLWSARRITSLSGTPKNKLGRAALWIMLPLLLCFGLPKLGGRLNEAISFRGGGVKEQLTVVVVGKNRGTRRKGQPFYEADLATPFTDRTVTLRVDEAVFDRIEPNRECVRLLIERAPNGAARLLMPLRWKVQCPW